MKNIRKWGMIIENKGSRQNEREEKKINEWRGEQIAKRVEWEEKALVRTKGEAKKEITDSRWKRRAWELRGSQVAGSREAGRKIANKRREKRSAWNLYSKEKKRKLFILL